MLKMYIAVLNEVPDHMVPVLVSHATLGAHLEFSKSFHTNQGTYILSKCDYHGWLKNSFRKVVLKANRKEFEKISALDYVYLAHENSTLNGEKSCAVVCPREENPRVLAFAKMWKPNDTEVTNRLSARVSHLEKQVSDYGWEQDQRSYNRMGL